MSSDPEAVPGVPVGEMVLTWTLLVATCTVGALVTGEFTRISLRAGALLLLAGGLLALASVRALGRGRELVTRGPYRWVRHPYFLGILVMLVGAIVALRSLPALILFYPAVRVTVMRARREEHNLGLRFGDAYHEYQQRVAMILPLRPPLPRAQHPGAPSQTPGA
ncbi:MAG: isoprenylcysteine carboxylmethyltransferase family protein [Thermoanaerobaculaceae bacterium]|nr:isoprenylcysteine carboxylmethyltransferase family protein [Thermoanaerobaculaceae bacterium]